MYEVDDRDRVTTLAGVPQSSVGAPNPLVVSDGLTVVLAYYLQDTPADWDGSSARMVGPTTPGEPSVLHFPRPDVRVHLQELLGHLHRRIDCWTGTGNDTALSLGSRLT